MTRWLVSLAILALLGPLRGARAEAQSALSAQPLVRPGEVLVYRVRSARFGDVGTAVLRVEGPDTINGRPAYRLMFDFNARILLFNVSDQTRSWLDQETLSTLRYSKDERSPIGRRSEAVEVSTTDSSWTEGGVRRPLATRAPLDELAFIYLARSVEPVAGESFQLERHFDAARNPVQLCVLGQETIEALGRSFQATVVQMDVPDARQGDGRSRLRIYVSADPERLVLRIDTSMPVAGALTLTLIAVNPTPDRP